MDRLQRIKKAVEGSEKAMFDCLKRMVSIQSGSYNKVGIDRLGSLLYTYFSSLPVSIRTVPQSQYGDHLIVRSNHQAGAKRGILLIGHMDTVFPSETSFNQYTENGQYGYGPGVIDMKGGLVVGLFALKCLEELGLLRNIPFTFLFNSDEEIGSPTSRELIREEAAKSAFGLVLEAGGLGGEIVICRKGNMRLEFTIAGAEGHAASAGPDKPSAVLEMAHLVIALEKLNAPGEGISVNVGKVHGGIGHNTVAGSASAMVDFRFNVPKQKQFLLQEVDRLCRSNRVPGTEIQYHIKSQRAPMPANANEELFQVFADLGQKLGIPVGKEFRVGVSDANIVAAAGIPVLDGLGPIGGDDHSDKEYLVKSSLVQRTVLLAAGLVNCWQRFGAGDGRHA